MTVQEIISVIAPELEDNPNLNAAIEIADTQIAINHCKRDLAVAYLTAHILTLSERGGRSGAVASKTEGSLSVSYATVANSVLDSTSYGSELQRINKQCYALSARTAWIN